MVMVEEKQVVMVFVSLPSVTLSYSRIGLSNAAAVVLLSFNGCRLRMDVC